MTIQKGPSGALGTTIEAGEIGSGAVTTAKLATDLVVTHALGSASTPSITFTGDTNTGIFSPTADTIAFSEGGAESMRIDASGNLFVGKTSDSDAAQGLSLYPSGSISYNDNNAGTRTQISFRRSGTQVGSIRTTTTNTNYFTTSSDTTGAVLVNAGIAFPPTQVASADANTLDDYEEGTFTGTIWAGSTQGTNTANVFRYIKIGRLVYIHGETAYAQSWPSGGVYELRGLPFPLGGTPFATGGCWLPGVGTTFRVVVPVIFSSYASSIRFIDNSRGSGGSWVGAEFGSGDFTPSTAAITMVYQTN
jgi:hypothetical protein